MIQSRAPGSPAFDRLAAMNRPSARRGTPPRAIAPAPLVAACALAALAACAENEPRMSPGLEQTILPATIQYTCDEGRVLRVDRSAGATSATASIGANRWELPRVDSAAQEKYASGATALYLDGDAALLESEGRVLGANCKSTVALPRAPAMRPYKF